MNKNIIAAIVLVIILLGTGYLVSKQHETAVPQVQSNTETNSTPIPPVPVFSLDKLEWVPYTNENYKYTIQFPKKAQLINSNASQGVNFKLATAFIGTISLPKGDFGNWKDKFYVWISSTKATPGLTLDQWVENELGKKQAPYPDVANKKITIDGEKAYYLEYSHTAPFGTDPYNYAAIYTIHNGIQYRIAGLKVGKTSDFALEFAKQSDQIFDAMIKSFKFTD